MSYLVLARKYRPRSFDTIVGQEHVVRALTHALETQRLHHAYLFTGTRGIGKTTLSRILAKSLNCETGITSKPCGKCEACIAIDNDRFVDYIEMDAASNTGIDNMRQVLEQAIYAPTNARFKVYMIDEVHSLSNAAFNAMLKTLEEPPEYVKFILATTDPQKVPVTVLSRCLQFNLKQMPAQQIVGHLENILTQENIEYETPALRLLAKGARGSMRDALSLTDQAIAFSAGKINLEAMQSMLGAVDQTYLIRILYALSEKDGKTMIDIADEMAQRTLSYENALQDLASLLHRIAIAQTVSDAIANDLLEREDIFKLASNFSHEEAQLFYQIALRGLSEMSLSPDDYAGFTMTLLRMLAFRPEEIPEPVAQKQVTRMENTEPISKTTQIKQQSSPPSGAKAALEMLRNKNKSPAAKTNPATSAQTTAEKKTPEPDTVKTIPLKLEWDGNWIKLSKTLELRGMVQQLAQQTELTSHSFEQGILELNLRLENKALANTANIQRLQTELEEYFKCKVRINTEFAKTTQTAEYQIKEEQSTRMKQAEENIKNNPLIQSIIQNFDATIVQNSIKPL